MPSDVHPTWDEDERQQILRGYQDVQQVLEAVQCYHRILGQHTECRTLLNSQTRRILSSRDNNILASILDGDISIRVLNSKISRTEVSTAEGLGSGGGVLEVLETQHGKPSIPQQGIKSTNLLHRNVTPHDDLSDSLAVGGNIHQLSVEGFTVLGRVDNTSGFRSQESKTLSGHTSCPVIMGEFLP